MAIFNSHLNVYQRVKKSTTCKGGRRLRLSDIQFSLCEFDKYQRCHAGGRVRCRVHPVRNSVLKTILQLWRGWGKDLTSQCTNTVQRSNMQMSSAQWAYWSLLKNPAMQRAPFDKNLTLHSYNRGKGSYPLVIKYGNHPFHRWFSH